MIYGRPCSTKILGTFAGECRRGNALTYLKERDVVVLIVETLVNEERDRFDGWLAQFYVPKNGKLQLPVWSTPNKNLDR